MSVTVTTTADYKIGVAGNTLELLDPIPANNTTVTIRYPANSLQNLKGKLVDPTTLDYVLTEDGWVTETLTNCGYKVKIAVHFPEGLRAIGTKDGKNYPLVVELEYRIRYYLNGSTIPTAWSDSITHFVSGVDKDAFTEVIEFNIPTNYVNNKADVSIRRVTFDFTEPKNEDKRYYYRCSLQTVTAYQQATEQNFVLKDPPKPVDTRLAKTALRLKATNQINGNIEGVNCVVHTITKVWTGSTPQGTSGSWALVKDNDGKYVGTSNPAALFMYLITHPGNPRRVNWDSNIINYVDMEQIQRWYLYCNNKHFNSSNTVEDVSRKRYITGTSTEIIFEFNDIVADQRGVLEVLRDICAAGRASPALINNKWTVVIDEPKDIIAQHFTPHNSWGFESTKILPKRPDALKIQYLDENNNYQQSEVIVATPGFTKDTAELFETISFVGITNSILAEDHGQWQFAQAILRPEIYTFNTDIEYLVCNRGDRVKVTHDIPMWGTASGRVKNVISTTQLELDEEIEMLANKVYTIRIRSVNIDGTVSSEKRTLSKVSVDSYVTVVTIDIDPLNIDPQRAPIYNANPQDLFMIGELNNEAHDLLVLSIEPASNAKSARLTLVDYASTIFTNYKTLTNLVFDPNITNLPPAYVESIGDIKPILLINDIRSDDSVMEKLSSNNFIYGIKVPYANVKNILEYPSVAMVEMEAELIEAGNAGSPVTVKVPFDSGAVVLKGVEEGLTYRIKLRYLTKNGSSGPWSPSLNHTVVGKLAPPENVAGLSAEIKPVQVSIIWQPCTNIDYDVTELRYVSSTSPDYLNPIWDAATPLWAGKTAEYQWARPDNGTYKVLARHKDSVGIYSVKTAIAEVTVTDLINAVSYDVEVESTNGTIFRLGLGTTTTLIAHVYENTVEVTDILPKYRFKWRRVSSDPAADLIWNDLYAPNKLNNVGYKQIEISVDEVNASATFHCDILTDE